MTSNAVEMRDVSQQFGATAALREVTLEVPRGSVFGLLGPNGAGKSTLLNTLMGLLPPASGQVRVLGLDPVDQDIEIRRRAGFVAEKHGFYERLTVDDHVAIVAPYHADWNQRLCAELRDAFELTPTARVSTLSKGQRARLALLLALSFEPEMLVLDEPAGGLDPAARRQLIEIILRHYQASEHTIVLSSHLLNEFAGLLDHVAILRDGRVEVSAPMQQLRDQTRRVRLVFEGGVPPDIQAAGADSLAVAGREVVAVFDRFDDAALARLARFNASHQTVEPLSLEDIFIERAAR